MNYLSSKEIAEKWGITNRYVRNLCKQGRIAGAVLKNDMWYIPANARRPRKGKPGPHEKTEPVLLPEPPLLRKLLHQRDGRNYSGLYEYTQINLAYSSCRMASGRLTRDQIKLILQKDKILTNNERIKVNDIIEARNHLIAFDLMLDSAMKPLTMDFILTLHRMLLSDSCDHKRRSVSSASFRLTGLSSDAFTEPARIKSELSKLLRMYAALETVTLADILDFHVRFEKIRPFDEANGRVGRLIMFKECLRHDITPFIIDDKRRRKYLDGISAWNQSGDVFEAVALEAQRRYAEQIEVQRMIAGHYMRNPEFMEK